MDVSYMKEFIALAANLNFTVTAEQLYMMQSTLSRHLIKIEEELGTKLFVRSTHDVILTEKGKRVYEEFQKIVTTYDALVNEISEQSSGQILFGVLYYAIDKYVTPILLDFKTKYPNTDISLSSHQSLQMIHDILSDKIEVGLLEEGDYSANHLLKFHTFAREKYALLICEDHPLAGKKSVSMQELANQTLVFMKSHSWMYGPILQYINAIGLENYNIQYSDHIDTLTMTLIETNGIAIVPEHLESMKRNKITMVGLLDEDESLYVNMCLVHKKDLINPNVNLLISRAKALFRPSIKIK